MGARRCGKTALVQRFGKNKFPNKMKMHMGKIVSSQSRVVNVNGLYIRLSLWDTPGYTSRRVVRFTNLFYRGNFQTVFICFDLSKTRSIQETKHLIDQMKHLFKPKHEIFLVGLKNDVRKYDPRAFDSMAKKLNTQVHCCSAKTGEGVFELVSSCAERITKKTFIYATTDSKKLFYYVKKREKFINGLYPFEL